MTQPSSEDLVSRRSFLDWLLGLGVVGTLAAAILPIFRYLKPLPQQGASGPVHLSAQDTATLDHDQFVIVRSGATRLLVFEDSSQKLRCLSAKCTHEGCTVQYVPGDGVIWCACHNGRFDVDGRVISGPPPRPLEAFRVDKEGKDIVIDGKLT